VKKEKKDEVEEEETETEEDEAEEEDEDTEDEGSEEEEGEKKEKKEVKKKAKAEKKSKKEKMEKPSADEESDKRLPFESMEPFGRETKGEALTETAIDESNAMVDQVEKAEVAEEKRSVYRALTRLRGVALSSFDGVANSQTANIKEYAKTNKWRKNHPVKHLAEEESDVAAWAFPSEADF